MLDSVVIDEDSSILHCYGSFYAMQPVVRINDTTLNVLSHGETEIAVSIPVVGRGSCGDVSIEQNGMLSKQKRITYFHLVVYEVIVCGASDGTYENIGYFDTLHFRSDLGRMIDTLSIRLSSVSGYHHWANGRNGIHGGAYGGPTFDSLGKLNGQVSILLQQRQIIHPCPTTYNGVVWMNTCFYPCDNIGYDSGFNVKTNNHYCDLSTKCYDPNNVSYNGWQEIARTEFPPSAKPMGIRSEIASSLHAHFSNGYLIADLTVPSQKLTIEVFDLLGRRVFTQYSPSGSASVAVDLRWLPTGVYLARIQKSNFISILRFAASN